MDLTAPPLAVTIAAVAFAAVAAFVAIRRWRAPRYFRRALLSPAEKRFYRVLTRVAGKRAIVVTKVRLADLLTVRARKRIYWSAFHKIAQKHVDFVLLDPATLEPIAAVELDDSSHERPDRKKRDRFVDRAMRQAGLPIHHVPVRRQYGEAEIRAVLGFSTRGD